MNLFKRMCALILIFYGSSVSGQNLSAKAKQRKIEYLSMTMSISIENARQLVSVLDESTKAANKVYNDSSLTSDTKKEKMEIIFNDRDKRIKQLVPDESKSNKMLMERRETLKSKLNEKN